MSLSNRRRLAGLALSLGLVACVATAAVAQDANPPAAGQDPQELAVEGLSKILQALDLFVKSVPQFAAPEVLPNGDIIIRRIHPSPAPAPSQPKSGDDGSST